MVNLSNLRKLIFLDAKQQEIQQTGESKQIIHWICHSSIMKKIKEIKLINSRQNIKVRIQSSKDLIF